MTTVDHSQSLSEFRENLAETLHRVNQTGDVELITVDGEAHAVLLSPSAYEEMEREVLLARDVTAIQKSLQDIKEGKCRDADEFFDELHGKLLAMKAAQLKGPTE